MPRVDFYRVLGVPREASDDVIKKAYRKLVFEHHPDRNPNSKDAEEKIREINAAYEIIGDIPWWIVALADPGSEWLTGQVIAVDGGLGLA